MKKIMSMAIVLIALVTLSVSAFAADNGKQISESTFLGGSIGSVVIIKNKYSSIGTIKKDNRKVNNKNALYNNIGEVYNGDRNR
mgnify:CR=1 FL=1